MKQETKKSGKLTVEDFPLQMLCRVTLEEYQNYAVWSSKESREKNKKKCLIQSAVLIVAGLIIVYQGLMKTWVYHDILTVFGILLIGYSLFDLFYQFIMFNTILKRTITKDFKKDPRLGRDMTFCFAEDHMASFYEGKHQGTFYYDDVIRKEEIQGLVLLSLKNGKTMVFPQHIIDGADPKIQEIISKLGHREG